MPDPINSLAIAEKNRLSSTGSWIVLLEITLKDGTEIPGICTGTDNITWPNPGGDLYQAFPFEFSEIEDEKGTVPQLELRVSNVTRALVPYLEQDAAGGGRGATVRFMVVNSKLLNLTDPEIDLEFSCKQPTWDAQWVKFSLSGSINPHNRSFPKGRVLKNFCRYQIFGGDRCGFPTQLFPGETCDRSLARCRELWAMTATPENVRRFGNAPGVGGTGLYD